MLMMVQILLSVIVSTAKVLKGWLATSLEYLGGESGRERKREREERERETGVGENLREREGDLILEVLLKYLLIYLAALDLSCGMWDFFLWCMQVEARRFQSVQASASRCDTQAL